MTASHCEALSSLKLTVVLLPPWLGCLSFSSRTLWCRIWGVLAIFVNSTYFRQQTNFTHSTHVPRAAHIRYMLATQLCLGESLTERPLYFTEGHRHSSAARAVMEKLTSLLQVLWGRQLISLGFPSLWREIPVCCFITPDCACVAPRCQARLLSGSASE